MNQNEKIGKIVDVLREYNFTIEKETFSTSDIISFDKEIIQNLFDTKLMFYTDVKLCKLSFQINSNKDFLFNFLQIIINLDIRRPLYFLLEGVIVEENIFLNGKETKNLVFKDWRIIEKKIS